MGGLEQLWNINYQGGRINFFEYDTCIYLYNNFFEEKLSGCLIFFLNKINVYVKLTHQFFLKFWSRPSHPPDILVFDYWDVFCMAVSIHCGSTNGSAIFFSALPKRRKIVSNYHQSTSLISTIKMSLNTFGITTVTLIRQGLTLCLSNISFILPFEHYVNSLTVLRQECTFK